MEIRTQEKNGIVYNNLRFSDMGVGEEDTFEFKTDKPYEGNGQWGKFYAFKLKYKEQDCSVIVNTKTKSTQFGVPLCDVLKKFRTGDVVKISKREGTTKVGQYKFVYFNVQKVGGDNNETETSEEEDVEVNANLSDVEKELVEGLKEKTEYDKDQHIEVCMKNGLDEQRAKYIVEEYILK